MSGVQELLDCQIANWYPRFQRVTFKTVILPLPQPVLDWLVSDGLHLPADSQAVRTGRCGRLHGVHCRAVAIVDALEPRRTQHWRQRSRGGAASLALSEPGACNTAVCDAGGDGPLCN